MSAIAPALVATVAALVACRAADSHAQCRFPDSSSKGAWTYRFRVDGGTDRPRLHVTAQLPLSPGGTLDLQLPVRWAGETLHAMTNLRSGSTDVRLEIGADGGSGVLRGQPDSLETITYDLAKDWSGPLVHPRQFHPVVMSEYVEVTGQNARVITSAAATSGPGPRE